MENVDVYGYGHLLYEMIYGEPMNKSTQDTFPNCPFLEIRNILESILSKNALSKTGLPTISQLLALPYDH
jgi:PX domain-containing protein kinase-like protein